MEDNALTKTMKNLSIFFKKKSKVNINNFLKKFILNKKISGPEILRKNLINGLRKNLVSFDINPNLDNVKNKCLVLDDVEILAQLIKIKEKKNIEIIAGPNLMIMPDEYNKILFRDEINKIIVPCDWVKKKYIEVSKSHLKNKIKIWAAGVDHKYWKPGKNKSIDVLLYSKFIRNDKIFEKCFKYLKIENIELK